MTREEYEKRYEEIYGEAVDAARTAFGMPGVSLGYCSRCNEPPSLRRRQKVISYPVDMSTECASCYVKRRVRENLKKLDRERDRMSLDVKDFATL